MNKKPPEFQNILQDTPFFVSEWEWLKLQLRLVSLETRGELWLTRFSFEEAQHLESEIKNRKIICKIYNGSIDEILKEVNTKEQFQEEYLDGWVEIVKQRIEAILNELPKLNEHFDLASDVKFEIMRDYGMGSYFICSIVGDAVSWNPNLKL
jgi:hypothetical protein